MSFRVEDKEVFVGMIVGKYYAIKDGNPDYKKIENNIRLAEKAAIELWNEGFAVFTPHLNTRHFEIKAKAQGEEIYQAFDRHVLDMIADFIFVLPNWIDSRGAKREIRLARNRGIPIFSNLFDLKKWQRIQTDSNPSSRLDGLTFKKVDRKILKLIKLIGMIRR